VCVWVCVCVCVCVCFVELCGYVGVFSSITFTQAMYSKEGSAALLFDLKPSGSAAGLCVCVCVYVSVLCVYFVKLWV